MSAIKNVAILGSTGSIGENALKVISSMPDRFRVFALTSFSNTSLLEDQVRRFNPKVVGITDARSSVELKGKVFLRGKRFFSGEDAPLNIASLKDADIVVLAISGAAAVFPLFSAIRAGKRICLANKESIVMAGHIAMKQARRFGAEIIPVDSEHSAIFQCLGHSNRQDLSRIYLTASGGSLFNIKKKDLASVTVSKVLRHPRWKMGRKITVDSATLMNKGLEVIEASRLFGVSVDDIEVLIHPQAVIHSMVEFKDSSIIAQLGVTDMRLPIQYALTYPDRVDSGLNRLEFSKIRSLDFIKPKISQYPCLRLALEAARLGGTYPAALSAADEEVVKAFLGGKIGFLAIPKIIEKVLSSHRRKAGDTLKEILEADRSSREEAISLCCH